MGKILKFPISLLAMDWLFYVCVSVIILAVFIGEFILSRVLFSHIKYYCQLKHQEILDASCYAPPDSFYESLKKVLQCPNFLITLSAALSLSVSSTFLDEQFYYA